MEKGQVSGGAAESLSGHGRKTRKRGRSYFGYIVERGSSLHFRISVPKQLRQAIGKTEIRLSLGSIAYTEARPRAYLLASRINMLFRFIAGKMKEGKQLDKSKLNSLMPKLLNWDLDYRESLLVNDYCGESKEDLARAFNEYGKEYSDRIYTSNEIDGSSVFDCIYGSIDDSDRDIKDVKHKSVKSIVSEMGCSESLASEMFDTFEDEIRTKESKVDGNVFQARGYFDRVSSIALKHTAKKVDGSFDINAAHKELSQYFLRSSEVESPLIFGVAQDVVRSDSDTSLGALVQQYVEKLDRSAGKANNKHGSKFKRRGLIELSLIVGKNAKVSNLTIDIIESYADKLKYIPTRLDIESMEYDINEYGVSRYASEALSNKTISKRLIDTRVFIDWLAGNRYIGKDHAESLMAIIGSGVKECKNQVDKEGGSPTRPYSMDELSGLFNIDSYLRWSKSKAYCFWAPLIALFTGMRMGEIMTLRRKDIKCTPDMLDCLVQANKKSNHKQKDGIYYIDLTSTKEKDLKTKSLSVYRPVPIHSFLIEIGLLDFVDKFSREEFIFRDGLMNNAGHENDYSRQFLNRYKLTDRFILHRRSLGIGRMKGETEGDMLDFHCFRNTVIARMKECYVNPEVRCEISGHSTGEEGTSNNESHNGYGGKFSVEQKLKDGIMKLDFHEQIPDLRLLAQSKWAKGGVKKRK
ncbi:site-specific integrase [Desulfomicrobium baculatum]|uniref:DUF6538 domain-containing protein n=1 Tax=Desulfomicrobium baculatum (strain DSM 4028 / VKM B-1378 / X) TaxID=525897 RepID=C7LPF7_DESBD|nr:site-specific integrase [Desulfomicrobium baculatum]ACU89000.1 hypothetical protein Dbac_0882 [Desulfomicrobium baculatum DSM 4028]